MEVKKLLNWWINSKRIILNIVSCFFWVKVYVWFMKYLIILYMYGIDDFYYYLLISFLLFIKENINLGYEGCRFLIWDLWWVVYFNEFRFRLSDKCF